MDRGDLLPALLHGVPQRVGDDPHLGALHADLPVLPPADHLTDVQLALHDVANRDVRPPGGPALTRPWAGEVLRIEQLRDFAQPFARRVLGKDAPHHGRLLRVDAVLRVAGHAEIGVAEDFAPVHVAGVRLALETVHHMARHRLAVELRGKAAHTFHELADRATQIDLAALLVVMEAESRLVQPGQHHRGFPLLAHQAVVGGHDHHVERAGRLLSGRE